jgi:TonB-linked SusC/RagA family outer membrane protein
MKGMKKSFTTKLWKGMRVCAVQGMIAIAFCGVTLAHNNYAQLMDKEVSFRVIDMPFEKVLKEIEQVAAIKFAYSFNQLQDEPNISLSIEKKTLRDVLEELLTPRNIYYKVYEKDATITLKKLGESGKEPSMHGTNKVKQERALLQITGTVIDASMQTPMAGVNVIVKGSTNGTTTDVEGKYALYAEDKDVIVFSFIGYASIELTVNGQSVIDIALKEDSKSLNEVVVNAGYWQVKEKEQTGNISRLTAETIQKQPVSNPLQAMQGRMAGVYIQQNTGMPGGSLKIQIRGQNSLRDGADGLVNGNLPLYLIDGVPFTSTSLTSSAISGSIGGGNPLSAINPNDIESIEVLKDADATAIYGSRGANGVVLITTKQAKAGKPKLDLDFYQGVGKVAHRMDMLSTSEYVMMRKEGFQNDGVTPSISNATDLLVWDTTRYTNWQKEFIGGAANVTNGNMAFSGGDNNTRFVLAGGYYRESTVFPGDHSFQRGTARLNLHHNSSDNRLQINTTINYTLSNSNIPSNDFTNLAVTLSPNAPALYDPQGNLNWADGTWTNPLATLERKYFNRTDNLVTNVSFGYEVVKGLRIKNSFGYTTMTVEEITTNPISSTDPQYAATTTGFSNFGDGNVRTWILEPMIDYNKTIGRGEFSALIGSTFQQSVQENQALAAYGYTNDALLQNLSAASTILIRSNDASVYKYAAAFARINYNWREKYIINLTGRRDGSSRFGPGNQFANFGAIGAAWIFSSESFLNRLKWLSLGKLRMSYGATGSDAIGNYQYLESFSATRYPYAGSSGLAFTRLANPEYSWETNKKGEVGIELGFLKNRINVSASYYLNRSGNQLVGLPLPLMTGQSSVQFNLPAVVENRGLEVVINTTNILKDKFEWTTSANITLPQNKLLEFPNLEQFPAYQSKYDVGNSVFMYKGYQFGGVNPETGYYQIIDQNEDNQFNSLDYVGLKQKSQKYYGGISNTFRFGSVEIDFLFQYVKQNGFGYQQAFGYPGTISNQPAIVLNRWQKAGDVTDIQRFAATDPTAAAIIAYYSQVASDNSIQDASFIRLKNASISWTLPKTWLSRIKLQQARIFIQGQNLLTFTNYIGLDPETQNSVVLPPLRMITGGIHVSL